MLDTFGVTEANWRDAIDPPEGSSASAPPDFALSETPRFVGRGVTALAHDVDRVRWNQRSVTSSRLAAAYGFTDLDGSQPDVWRYMEEIQEQGLTAPFDEFR